MTMDVLIVVFHGLMLYKVLMKPQRRNAQNAAR